MTPIDLVAEFNRYVGKASKVAPELRVDLGALAVALATAWAEDMAANLSAGRTPDGTGTMRRRRSDGAPRGSGTSTASSITLQWSKGSNRMVIVANETERDALKRILRGVPFRPPETSPRIAAVKGDAAAIATLTAGVRRARTRMWSPKRLASWRSWKRRRGFHDVFGKGGPNVGAGLG